MTRFKRIRGGSVDVDPNSGSADDDLELSGLDADDTDADDYDADDDDDTAVVEKVKRVRVAASTLPPLEKVQVMFGLPAELKAKIEAAAIADKVASGAYVRDLVARHFEYTLPAEAVKGARRKYGSEEEKKAAQAAATAKRNATVRELMLRYNKGEITLPAEVEALLAGLQTPEDAAKEIADDAKEQVEAGAQVGAGA